MSMDASQSPSVPTGQGSFAPAFMRRIDAAITQPALRRALPAISVLGVAVLALGLWLLLAPPERMQLQPGLPAAEKARALDALTAAGIPARLDPGSGALTVPAASFHEARMLLATEGLPQGQADGLQAIENMPMGTSRQVEAARLRRMQELDLSRTISELRPVRAARVHLALPERTAFVRDTEPPRASVVLELAPGLSLDQGQVQAIVSMVAAAVQDMPRGNVSVVDQAGTLLTAEETDPMQAAADRQLAHQQRMERLYRERVMALLTPMVGVGNAAVEITLDMDFTRSEITSEEFSPDTALRSEQASQQSTSNAGAIGIPGAISNTPPPEPELVEATEETEAPEAVNMTRSSTRNYEVSRRVETRQPQVAKITRVHAAVLLHETPPTDGTAAEAPGDARDNARADIEALTKSAIGFDEARGDIVTVASAPFVAPPLLMAQGPWYEAPWLPAVGRVLAQVAIIAIVVLGIIRPLMTRLLPPPPAPGQALVGYGDAVEVQRGESFTALRQRIETATPSIEDLDGSLSYEEKINVVRQLTDDDANRISGVFKSMLDTKEEAAR
ncbi:MAG: flagellar basal-body MS-ring/collar protein FliF [Pseudomonadota bacterium]